MEGGPPSGKANMLTCFEFFEFRVVGAWGIPPGSWTRYIVTTLINIDDSCGRSRYNAVTGRLRAVTFLGTGEQEYGRIDKGDRQSLRQSFSCALSRVLKEGSLVSSAAMRRGPYPPPPSQPSRRPKPMIARVSCVSSRPNAVPKAPQAVPKAVAVSCCVSSV